MFDILQGKKIYIMSILTGILGIISGDPFNVEIPQWLWAIDGVAFSGALRSTMAKMEMK